MALLNQYAAAGLDHQAGSTGGVALAAHGSSQLTELLGPGSRGVIKASLVTG